MASVSLCDPCQGQDKHVTGIQWCPDCEVNLCSDCVSYHKSLKTTKDHDLADINAPFNAAAEISKQQCCIRHADLKVEYFCTAHDELCCHACLVETHRSCDKVVALDVVCKSASSRILDDPNNEIKFIGKTLKSIDEEMKLNLSTLKVENTGIKKKIAEAKAKAISRINENEANLRTELKKRKGQSLTKIYEIIAKTKSMADKLEHQVNKINFVQQHGTNKQAFILFHRLKTFLAEVNKSVLDFPSSTTTLTMDFEENNELISLLPTLGEISISEKFIPVKITQFKQLSAQCANLHASKPFTSYIKISQFSTSDEVNISGMISTTDGKLLMCDYCFSSGVLVYSENGQYIQTITTNSRPFDILLTVFNLHTGSA